MPPTSNSKKNAILSGCEDLLNDFSIPEDAHSGRFVSIDHSVTGNSITSSPTATPGSTANRGKEGIDTAVESELARSKKAWGRAIDRYVSSVLEDNEEGGGGNGSVTSGGHLPKGLASPGASSQRSRRSRKSHPDNHLLLALEKEIMAGDGGSTVSSRSVNENGQIDDSSFAPMNPFGPSRDATFSTDPNSKKEKIKQYVKEEWKPISLIALVILVTIIVSASMGGGGSSAQPPGKPESPGLLVDTPNDITSGVASTSSPTDSPTLAPSTGNPTADPTSGSPTGGPTEEGSTYFPTYAPTATSESPTDAPVAMVAPPPPEIVTNSPTIGVTPKPTGSPTNKPTSKKPTMYPTVTPTPKPTTSVPTSSPTPQPTTSNPTSSPTTIHPTTSPTVPPSMPASYFEMKKAAEYVSGSDAFNTTSSTQSLAFHWLYFEGNPSTNLYEFFEQYAVACLFFSLTQARTSYAYLNPEKVHEEFTERKEVCGWEGVRCAFNYTSEMVHVTEVHLSDKNLTGTIPEEIRFLPYVNKLDLSDNEIVGSVPEDLYELKRLKHLYLNNNKLEGTISSSIDDLHLAEQIYLGQNSFTGTLPSNIGTNRPNEWRFFSIYDNQLTGPIHEGMKLKNAYMLDFSRNDFYGTIPSDIAQENYSTLRLLYLDHNTLTGTIPASVMQMRKMKAMHFNDNRLEGMIPYNIDDDLKYNLLTIRAQNNRLTHPVAPVICGLDVNKGMYELVELGVDCEICHDDCQLCKGRCY